MPRRKSVLERIARYHLANYLRAIGNVPSSSGASSVHDSVRGRRVSQELARRQLAPDTTQPSLRSSSSAADNGPTSSDTRDGSQPGFDTRASYQEHIQPEPRERGDEDPGRTKDGDDNTTHEMDGSTRASPGIQHMPTPLVGSVAGTRASVIKDPFAPTTLMPYRNLRLEYAMEVEKKRTAEGNTPMTSTKRHKVSDATALPTEENSIRNTCMRHWNEHQPDGQGHLSDFDAYFKSLTEEEKQVCPLGQNTTDSQDFSYAFQELKNAQVAARDANMDAKMANDVPSAN